MKKIVNQLRRRKRTGKDTISEISLDIISRANGFDEQELIAMLVEEGIIEQQIDDKSKYHIKVK